MGGGIRFKVCEKVNVGDRMKKILKYNFFDKEKNMKKIFIILAIFVVSLGYTFAEAPESYSEPKMKICFDVSEAFGFSTFPDTPEFKYFNQNYTYKDTLEENIFLKNNVSLKLMLSCKANETFKILPYLGLDFMNFNLAFNLGVDFEIKEKHNFGVGMLIGASEWESKFNNKKEWVIEYDGYDYELDKMTFESTCLRFLVSYSYFIHKSFYVGTNVGFDILRDIEYKEYLKNSNVYCYNTKTYDGTEFVFQIKVGYRFNK